MRHTHEPDPTSPPHAIPICPACGKDMRLIVSEPIVHYINLDTCTFECECGQTADYVVARKDLNRK
jgi:hypothetical protein